MTPSKIFRSEIKESRSGYFVVYNPADLRSLFATLHLVFLDEKIVKSEIAQAMEKELALWLSRYAVPVMVSALDASDSVVNEISASGETHLMGFLDSQTGKIVSRWGLMENDEMPADQMTPEYLSRIYEGIPFRTQEEVEGSVRREMRQRGKAIKIFVIFVFVVPVLIQILSLGIPWLGLILTIISIGAGSYKAAKSLGWLKPTEKEKAKSEKEQKMKHYYWHCERNPMGFNRLKSENFRRETIEETRKEAEEIAKAKVIS